MVNLQKFSLIPVFIPPTLVTEHGNELKICLKIINVNVDVLW